MALYLLSSLAIAESESDADPQLTAESESQRPSAAVGRDGTTGDPSASLSARPPAAIFEHDIVIPEMFDAIVITQMVDTIVIPKMFGAIVITEMFDALVITEMPDRQLKEVYGRGVQADIIRSQHLGMC